MPDDDEDLINQQVNKNKLAKYDGDETEEMPQPDYSPTAFAPMQAPNGAQSAVSDYMQSLNQVPRQADYHPSRLRSVLSAIAGVGAGLANQNAQAGMQTAASIKDQPYQQAMQTWQRDLGPKQQLAQMYSAQAQAQYKQALDQSKLSNDTTKANADLITAQSKETPEQKAKREFEAIRMKANADMKIATMKVKDPNLHFTYDEQSGVISAYDPQTGQKVMTDQATPKRPWTDPMKLKQMEEKAAMDREVYRENAIAAREKNVAKSVAVQSQEAAHQMILQEVIGDPEYKDYVKPVLVKGPLEGKLTLVKPTKGSLESMESYNKRLNNFKKLESEVYESEKRVTGQAHFDPDSSNTSGISIREVK